MEDKRKNLIKSALYWGVIMAVASIIYSLLSYFLGFKPTSFMNMFLSMLFGLIIFIVVMILALKSYRNEVLGGAMTFGQAFVFGFFVILIGTFISSLYTYIFMAFIDPDYMRLVFEETMANTEEFLINTGMSEEQVSKAMDEAAKQPLPTAIGSAIKGFFGGVIFQTLVNLIFAAIMKKSPEIKFDQE